MTDRRTVDRRAEVQRLRLRVEELNAALKRKQHEFLGMLDQLQEREEEAVRRALDQLSRSEERVAAILESAAEGIFGLDADGRITFLNASAAKLLGASPEELGDRPVHDAIRHDREDGRPCTIADCPMLLTLEDGRSRRVARDVFVAHDGEAVTVEYTATPILKDGRVTGAVVTFRDISEQLRQQQSLENTAAELEVTIDELQTRTRDAEAARAAAEKAERRMAFLAEASAILATSLDYQATLRRLARLAVRSLADWSIVDIIDENGVIRRLAVATADAALAEQGREYQRRFPPERASPYGVARVIRTGRPELIPEVTKDTLAQLARSPEQLRVLEQIGLRSLMIVPLTARERVLGALSFASTSNTARYDQDDLALATDLAGRAALAVDNARLYEEALVANRAKSQFLAVMSHELRTPLNAILGYSDLLLSGVPAEIPAEAHHQVERVSGAARHLLQIIEEILSFSRIEAGQEMLQSSEFELVALVRDVAELVRPLASEKGLEFRVDAPASPLRIRSDERKLRQILLNLLSNAIKFTEQGEVVVAVRQPSRGRIAVAVCDTGGGIAEADRRRIFDPFWQVEQGTTRRAGGTGLGLSVASQLATMMGGELALESEPGRGSTFTLFLPERMP